MKPSDYIALAAVTVSLLAVAFNLFLDRKKRIADKRAEAYIDFLKHMSLLANLQDRPEAERFPVDAAQLEAKQRILLYGSPRVIQALVGLQLGGGDFTTDEGGKSFVALVQAMQKDCSGVCSTPEQILTPIVYLRGLPHDHFANQTKRER